MTLEPRSKRGRRSSRGQRSKRGKGNKFCHRRYRAGGSSDTPMDPMKLSEEELKAARDLFIISRDPVILEAKEIWKELIKDDIITRKVTNKNTDNFKTKLLLQICFTYEKFIKGKGIIAREDILENWDTLFGDLGEHFENPPTKPSKDTRWFKSLERINDLMINKITSMKQKIDDIKNGKSLNDISMEDRTAPVVLAAVRKDGLALQFVPHQMKTEKVIRTAMENNVNAFHFLPEDLKDLVVKHLRANGHPNL